VGAHPYWYLVPYRKDVQAALDALRAREFEAGRYNPVLRYIKFAEPAFSKQTPGSQHETIDDAIMDAGEEGTRSILDITRIGASPDYGVAAPLSDGVLRRLYGTDRPTRDMVRSNTRFLDEIQRGMCVYAVVYNTKGAPNDLLFAGYSFD
jgi:hypothetical protein